MSEENPIHYPVDLPRPRLLVLGHVTCDELADGERPGGAATYASLTARRLGWETGVVTCAGSDFEPERVLPDVATFLTRSERTTRFRNLYVDGERQQHLLARADDVDASQAPVEWLSPEVLLLAPVAGEVPRGTAHAFRARLVGTCAQGWLRDVDPETGLVRPAPLRDPDFEGADVAFVSEQDLGGETERVQEWLSQVPMVLLTRGERGADLITRDGSVRIPSHPSPEVDPTGAGDVFATAFMIALAEGAEPPEAVALACCTAACAVEAPGTTGLPDRGEVERRRVRRERWLAGGGEEDGREAP